ncbi:MAG TPA: Uma2 family endonuclease [Rhizobiales bacterium]|nr:Uma2 family endonuclease [Hyphomicrobiales bacterium]
MNDRFTPDGLVGPATTRAADGMPRRARTLAEIEAMQAAGIIGEDERFELIGGEVVPMQAKGGRHEMVKVELDRHLQQTIADALTAAPETTLRLDEHNFVEPDFCVYPRAVFPGDLRGNHVLLAIEVADSSLAYDLGRKIGIHACFGVPEVWVIDANTLVTHVHRRLGARGYEEISSAGPAQTLAAARAPSVANCRESLGLRPL